MFSLRSAVASATLALACACAGCSIKSDKAANKARPPPLVSVSRVEARDVPVEVRAPVELRPIATADVGSKSLGYLDAVLVDRGDPVKRGQLVALVRPSDLPDQLAASRGQLAQTEAQLSLARSEAENAATLAKSGAISDQALLQARAALAATEASREAARAQTAGLATRLGEARLTAPLDGIVSQRRLDPGALVGPTSGAILTIVNIDVLRVFVTVPEREIRGVSVGKSAHVELDSFPGKSFTGKVVRVPPTIDPTTRTLEAEVHLTNPATPESALRPGMFGRGSIVVEVHPRKPVIPVAALQISGGKRFVFVLGEGDKVSRRAVETGVDEGQSLEILSGVREGEEVVVAGIDGLADGALVRVVRDLNPYSGKKADAQPEASGANGNAAPPPAARN